METMSQSAIAGTTVSVASTGDGVECDQGTLGSRVSRAIRNAGINSEAGHLLATARAEASSESGNRNPASGESHDDHTDR